jgi:hypothetical protein
MGIAPMRSPFIEGTNGGRVKILENFRSAELVEV